MKNIIPIALIGALTLVLGLTISNRMSAKSITDKKMMTDDNLVLTEDKEIMDEKEMMDETEDMVDYMDVSPAEAKALIDENSNLVVIDVSPNYDQGHLPGAINYYLGDGSLDEAIPTLDKSKDYLVYCHVDSVAIAGAKKLVEAGFSPVYRLEGNYSAWVDAGYPVEK